MNKLIFKLPNKRVLKLNNKEFEVNKEIAEFIANNSKNIQIVYEMNKKEIKKNKEMRLCF